MAICLTLLAVLSPLYVDRRQVIEPDLDEEPISFSCYLPLLMFLLIMAITLSRYLDSALTSFDPNWIHRVGGSSPGIIVLLLILALVLRFKSV